MDTKQEKMCVEFNKIRMQNQNRNFSSTELQKLLKTINVGGSLMWKMIHSSFFHIHRKGRSISYEFTKEPIYRAQFVKLTTKAPKFQKSFDEKECINFLKSRGYEIKKCIGIDESALKAAHPEIYNQFLTYQEV